MTKPILATALISTLALAVAAPGIAQAPPFQTPAPTVACRPRRWPR